MKTVAGEIWMITKASSDGEIQEVKFNFVGLQYLRGIAALMVVYFHSILQLKNIGVIHARIPLFGEAGVDIFFVLSGFVMWVTTVNSQSSGKSFIRNRLIRIIPLYWALTVLAGLVALAVPELLKHTVFDIKHIVLSLFFIPSINPSAVEGMGMAVSPLLVPGWTLNYEVFFYMLFACTLTFQSKFRFLLLLFVFVAFSCGGIFFKTENTALDFYSAPIIFEFLLGIFVAILVRADFILHPMASVALAFTSFLSLMYFSLFEPQLNRLVLFGLPSALIVYSVCCMELKCGMFKFNLLKIIGDSSYSLYLTHIFTLVLCRVIFTGLVKNDSLASEIVFVLICIALSSLVGFASYYFYEKPMAVFLNKFKA
jgi:exopolysaccharide production protein ExoZ